MRCRLFGGVGNVPSSVSRAVLMYRNGVGVLQQSLKYLGGEHSGWPKTHLFDVVELSQSMRLVGQSNVRLSLHRSLQQSSTRPPPYTVCDYSSFLSLVYIKINL